ncbi:hypothetical protein [Leptospira ilyithenensis]|uniref:Uncharacterized protein n=1 Tax=Leptospira ilyithenensis TaxID=2484901 RepID=A0A4R9LTC2_9LEPT|nr:hypothetical protein [Leptospira ilyithenensis]TGN16747.1 hypothetical protein EHS11_00050 [Leptospira ilyithenensis]
MEKFRIGVFLFLLLVLAVLTFSLSKSWKIYESGYEVTVDPIEDKDTAPEPTDEFDLENGNGKVFWKQFFIYPVGLVTESGGYGPDGTMAHARNLYSVNLKTGAVKKFFPRNVYVWDYFLGEFSKQIISNIDEPKLDSLGLDKRLLVFAATEDTNKDGVLNHKDGKRLYLYDPDKEELSDILPQGYVFRKLIYNTAKNTISSIIKKNPPPSSEKAKGKKAEPESPQEIFSYDVITAKGVLAKRFE